MANTAGAIDTDLAADFEASLAAFKAATTAHLDALQQQQKQSSENGVDDAEEKAVASPFSGGEFATEVADDDDADADKNKANVALVARLEADVAVAAGRLHRATMQACTASERKRMEALLRAAGTTTGNSSSGGGITL